MRRASQTSNLRELGSSVVRPMRQRRRMRAAGYLQTVPEALAAFSERWPACEPDDRPILLLGSAWRSGSTLLQRIVTGGGDALVWGEPWHRADLVHRLAESVQAIGGTWPAHPVFYDEVISDDVPAAQSWLANLFPEAVDLVEGHRALFRTTFAEPARRRGYATWGIKDVRMGIEATAYFRWLFPDARIVFIHRDPMACWISYRSARLQSYHRFPRSPVYSAYQYGKTWAGITAGMLEHGDRYGVLRVRYEDLVADPAPHLAAIEDVVGVPLDRSAIRRTVGASTDHRSFIHERLALERGAGRVLHDAGYG